MAIAGEGHSHSHGHSHGPPNIGLVAAFGSIGLGAYAFIASSNNQKIDLIVAIGAFFGGYVLLEFLFEFIMH